MTSLDDHELLAEYARAESEPAFAALVARYVNLVYSAALRFAGNPHHAEEITQAVFIILAGKAGRLSDKTILSGWLYQTARLTAANFVKGEIRRQRREQEAYMQSTLTEPDWSRPNEAAADAAAWEQIAPLLDEALGRLGETDRNAIILRFFEDKTASEIAAVLKLNEAAAHKRVARGLEKLRKYFVKRGVTLTTAMIAGTVSANSVHAAPVGLAKTIAAVAITKGAAAGGSTLTLVKGALKLMAWTKVKTVVVASVVVLLAAGTTTVTIERVHQKNEAYRRMNQPNLETEAAIAKIEAHLKTAYKPLPRAMIVHTKFSSREAAWASDGSHLLGYNQPIKTIVELAFSLRWNLETRAILETNDWPQGRFDFNADSVQALQHELKRTLGIVGIHEKRETDVLLLTLKNPKAQGLKTPTLHYPDSYKQVPGKFFVADQQVSTLAYPLLEFYLGLPVIDRTGLTNRFDIDLTWDEPNPKQHNFDGLKQALLDQLGLELVPTNMPIEMLVVEKVK